MFIVFNPLHGQIVINKTNFNNFVYEIGHTAADTAQIIDLSVQKFCTSWASDKIQRGARVIQFCVNCNT